MKSTRLREIGVQVSLVFSLVIFIFITATSSRVLQGEKNSIFKDMRQRAELFSSMAGHTLFPRLDRFSLHFLVTTVVTDKIIKFAAVTDPSGKILSHSDSEKIGSKDATKEGIEARRSKVLRQQVFTGADGLEYYYFSNPVILGDRRLGTVALALNSETIKSRLAATKHKLLLIFFAALASIVILAELRALMNLERKASAFKSAMVRTVSHEFNNSLTVLSAALFILEENDATKTDPDRLRLYRTLESERKSLARYVKNILNEARMEAGRFKADKKSFALGDLVTRSVTSIEGLISQKKISFSLKLTKEPVLVKADYEAMALVLSNLIGNAVKYTPAGGTISVEVTPCAEKTGHVTFCVKNSGGGISAGDIEKLKTEFFRTSDGKAAASGFGLGLKVASEMLALHDSSLEIKSEQGVSSSFYFSLPLAVNEPAPLPASRNGEKAA